MESYVKTHSASIIRFYILLIGVNSESLDLCWSLSLMIEKDKTIYYGIKKIDMREVANFMII